jgi:pimeloyl-ACP methyl ester carboxylesterase
MSKPTIVLIHGAFTDASSWRPVYNCLTADGYAVLAPPNPLRGITYDASHTASLIDQLEGRVVLVGHSYGGAVATVAGNSDKVAALVYVAAVVCDVGESVKDLQSRFPGLDAGSLFRPTELPDGSVEISIDPVQFPDAFGADLTAEDAAFMAISQRSLSATALEEPAISAAWRVKPSWAVFGSADGPVNPELQRYQYARAGSKVTEVDAASHLVLLSRPETVADVIREAATVSVASQAA